MSHETIASIRGLEILNAESRISGVIVRSLPVFADPRGWLTELIKDAPEWRDVFGQKHPFAMSYISLTEPGEKRDDDQWHHHDESLPGGGQADRFIVLLGEMFLVLYDDREDSVTKGRLEVVRLQGVDWKKGEWPAGTSSVLLLIPPGVKHCIGNLSSEPFLLQNFPTKVYDGEKERKCREQGTAWLEGRTPFVSVLIPQLDNQPFSWEIVERLLDSQIRATS